MSQVTNEVTNKERRQFAAIQSGDPNKVLLAFGRRAGTILFHHSLNAVTANALSDAELLEKPGISNKTIVAIRMANRTAKGDPGVKYHLPQYIINQIVR